MGTCGYSCGAPHISQLLQAITSRLLHFSSVATRASVTFFCILAFLCILSSLPGFLIQSDLYVVLATSLLRLPLPTVPSPCSSPASTGSTCEANLLLILQTGAFA